MTTRLLIAESHAGFRRDLGLFVSLLDGDYEVIAAVETAAEALAEAERLHPDVALIDLDLRDRRGLAVARALGGTTPGTAIIVIGGPFDDEYRVAALDAGATDYIVKRELVEALPPALLAARPIPVATVTAEPVAPARPVARHMAGLVPWQWIHLLIAVTCLLVTNAAQHLRATGGEGLEATVAVILVALLGILLLEVRQFLRARPTTWFVG